LQHLKETVVIERESMIMTHLVRIVDFTFFELGATLWSSSYSAYVCKGLLVSLSYYPIMSVNALEAVIAKLAQSKNRSPDDVEQVYVKLRQHWIDTLEEFRESYTHIQPPLPAWLTVSLLAHEEEDGEGAKEEKDGDGDNEEDDEVGDHFVQHCGLLL
jgi:hypothetical protein